MKLSVVHVEPVSDQLIYVELQNGTKGVFDVSPFWHKGILRELQQPAYFRRVGIEYGAVTWPNGQDIAPETLAQGLQVSEPNSMQLLEQLGTAP